jgi:hypothetical protein
MNSVEIDNCVAAIEKPPRLRNAALWLQDFRDLIDAISDGWHMWSHGTKCSQDLQDIVWRSQWPVNQHQYSAASWQAIHNAELRVKTFLRLCKQTKANPRVLEFLKTH